MAKTKKTTDGAVSKRDHVAIGLDYARRVITGEVSACKWVRMACERQIEDLKRWDRSGPYKFDRDKANHVCRFVELLPHIKGPKAGTRIVLEPWQCFITTTVFGWLKRDTQTRRFRKVYIEVPRGNAKSTWSAGIALYMAFADGEGGAEAYSAATTADQAREVWEPAWHMVRQSEGLQWRYGVAAAAHAIHQISTASRFTPLASDDKTLDGKNIHIAVVDELHAHKTRGVHDVLETGLGKRTQSMLWEITTAGFNRSGVCYEVRNYITRLLQRIVDDDSYFGIVYTIDDGDSWDTEYALVKANPNWGVSVDVDIVRSTQRQATQMASAVNSFLTKHLDVWVSADTAFFDMQAWERCRSDAKIDDFEGQPCIIGLDLAAKYDLASKMFLFERDGDWYVFGRHYLPSKQAEQSESVNAALYAGWSRMGRLVLTQGDIIDYEFIERDILLDCNRFGVKEIAFDPREMTYLHTRLDSAGIRDKLVEYPVNIGNYSDPMKELDAMILAGRVHHDGDPVLAFALSNVVAHVDAKEMVFPRKERPENKIDPVTALLACVGRHMRTRKSAPSIYDNPVTCVV